MIDTRFSKEEFDRFEIGSQESLALHKVLEAEIAADIHDVVERKFRELAQTLSELGHNLTESEIEYDSEFSSWSYEFNDGENKDYPRIWLSTQVGVMSGYEPKKE